MPPAHDRGACSSDFAPDGRRGWRCCSHCRRGPDQGGRDRVGGRLGRRVHGTGCSGAARPAVAGRGQIVHPHLAAAASPAAVRDEVESATPGRRLHTADPSSTPTRTAIRRGSSPAYVAGPSRADALQRSGPSRSLRCARWAPDWPRHGGESTRPGSSTASLKPGNILLVEDGPRVIDFGIARAFDVPVAVTATGASVGTPRYMAPEQFGGERPSRAPPTCSPGSRACPPRHLPLRRRSGRDRRGRDRTRRTRARRPSGAVAVRRVPQPGQGSGSPPEPGPAARRALGRGVVVGWLPPPVRASSPSTWSADRAAGRAARPDARGGARRCAWSARRAPGSARRRLSP